ncbi:hypothetical protein Micbo1qcDRAFT_162735 [Microdochium bolleyi]|uniref:Uncharacterized protein n=1 Tax=Microdochium bolleyi TaxID=196109 RepID=A0A136J5S6_9PEZI|nr:hypothetical protein Micbo1qcDRAFT_162735 [Microdochium bolleyi]
MCRLRPWKHCPSSFASDNVVAAFSSSTVLCQVKASSTLPIFIPRCICHPPTGRMTGRMAQSPPQNQSVRSRVYLTAVRSTRHR